MDVIFNLGGRELEFAGVGRFDYRPDGVAGAAQLNLWSDAGLIRSFDGPDATVAWQRLYWHSLIGESERQQLISIGITGLK